jgi:two-component system C4-dicarboxylate transport sensor histidine kinase DctB
MMSSQSNTSLASRLLRTAHGYDRKILGWSALFICFLLVTYAFYFWTMQSGIGSLRESAKQRLEVYVSSLESVLGKYDYLPKTLELNKDVFNLLQTPDDPGLVAIVNQYLEQVNDQAKANTIYILDLNGVTLASSNWNKPDSFVGVDLAFRPYVQDALHQTPGRFYAIGTTSNEAGYYFAHGIYRNGKMLGVATVKVSLEKLENSWIQGADKVMLVDENNVIFLSSIEALKYKTLGPLAQNTIDRLNYTRQYHKQKLEPIRLKETENFPDGARLVSFGPDALGAGLEDGASSDLLTQGSTLLQPDWRFLLLSDLSKVEKSARATSAFAAAMFGCLMFLFLYLRQRQLAIAQSIAAKEALQDAYENLEVMVAERTSELNSTTQELTQEIAERRQAQQALQTTQNELIQAGKMAVLGQMSAGITHELNQPLTALRTMSDNAQILLDRGMVEDARRNLATISQVVERMGTITRQLKVFARKSTSVLTVVSIRSAVMNALFLVDRRLQLEKVSFEQRIPEEDVFAMGDNNRLEQVLVNLFNNALDSMANSSAPCLTVDVRGEQERVFITVKDNGTGIPNDVMQHLFEPFFTTKEQGAGLGLGLVISAQIVREFGGILSGQNAPGGGAEFTVELRAAAPGGRHA